METHSGTVTTDEMLAGIASLLAAETRVGGSAAERLRLAVAAVRLRDRLDAVAKRLVAAAENSDAGMVAVGASVKTVLVQQLVMSPRAAGGLVRRSVAQAGRPEVQAAAEAGRVNVEQATVIVNAIDALPERELTTEQIDSGERTLVGMADEFHAGSLKVLGGRLLEVIAPDEADRLEESRLAREWRSAHAGRFLQFRDDGHGTTTFSGLLPTTSAVLIRSQLDAYAAAARRAELDLEATIREQTDGAAEQRGELPPTPASMGQRQADALVTMAEQCAAERIPPAVAGDRPRVLVLMGYEKLLAAARVHAAGQSGSMVAEPGGDPRGSESTVGPDGIAAQLMSGERVPAGVLRRWLCDAEVLPVVLGGESQVLDVGRARRFATPAQRVALTVRDRGCVFPGCDVPAHLCQAHRIPPWEAGGRTDLGQLALLCWHHHPLCEPGRPARDQWEIAMIDGIPAARPPTRVDSSRRPLFHERFLKPIRPG